MHSLVQCLVDVAAPLPGSGGHTEAEPKTSPVASATEMDSKYFKLKPR